MSCLTCGRKLKGRFQKKFCSLSCSAKTTRNRASKYLGIKYLGNCLNCGELTRNPKFCSVECQWISVWRARVEKIQRFGLEFFERSAKRYILETRGIRCEICGTTKWMKQEVPLVLDHIDGNPEDHREHNLRLVCGNCDMQLPTYKSKNMGNGRWSRRQRMKEGKSF